MYLCRYLKPGNWSYRLNEAFYMMVSWVTEGFQTLSSVCVVSLQGEGEGPAYTQSRDPRGHCVVFPTAWRP